MLPAIQTVLAVTDLSDFGNLAVAHAYAVVDDGGTVHLLHVVEPRLVPSPLYAHYHTGRAPTVEERRLQEEELAGRLRALVPPEATERGVGTRVAVRDDAVVSDAIVAEADRVGADLLCIGSHGRTGIVKALLGSVAGAVLKKSRRPTLVVRPPE